MPAETDPVIKPPEPAPAPAQPDVPLKATYVFTLFPDTDGAAPEPVDCTSMETMITEMFTRMMKHGSGWIYPVINGQRAVVSMPRQTFKLKLADGTLIEIGDPSAIAFDANGRFTVLGARA